MKSSSVTIQVKFIGQRQFRDAVCLTVLNLNVLENERD